jgi:predicted acyl esterase
VIGVTVARLQRTYPGGRLRYVIGHLHGMIVPPVQVSEPEPGPVEVDHNVGVTVRDGTVLRVNVHRPPGNGPFPAILAAHPYGKDKVPVKRRSGYKVSFQYRALRQTATVPFSTLTTWEAPDPAWWAKNGYVVINADLRGAGTSESTLARTQWTPLYLNGDGSLSRTEPSQAGQETFQIRRQIASFTWRVPGDAELTGPMAAHMWVASPDADDLDLIVGVEKWRNGRYVPFEGSYGWGVTGSPAAGSAPRCATSTPSNPPAIYPFPPSPASTG